MIETSLQKASQVASYLMLDTYLDSMRVYSSSLVLCFARLNEQEKPSEVWLTSTGVVRAFAANLLAPSVADALLDERGVALYVLCQLIGENVSFVQVSADGVLEFSLGDCDVRFQADDVNTEEVWSITSDSPDPAYQHRWSITLDEFGGLAINVPRQEQE